MSGLGLTDNSSDINGVGVNTDHEIKAALTLDSSKSGFTSLVSEKGVSILDEREMRELEVTDDYSIRTAQDNILFAEYPTGTALNSSTLSGVVTTQTVVVGSNRFELNSSGINTVNTGSMLRTWRTFPWFKANALYAEFALNWTLAPVSNWVAEWGFFNSTSAIAAITDGVFFRIINGAFRGVICNNSQETYVDLGPLPAVADVHDFVVELNQDTCYFWHEGMLLGKVNVPAGQYGPMGLAQCQMAVRTYNGAVIPASIIKIQVSAISCSLTGVNTNRLWPTAMAGMGGGCFQNPTGVAAGQTTAYVNGTVPTTRATSATTKMEVGLGGQTTFAAYAGSEIDYNLFGYQVPVGKTLIVRGVRIESANLGAAVATTATLLQWSIGVGANADTLAGTESATVKVRRAIPMGFQSFPIGAVIGSISSPVDVNFDSPLVVHGGEWFQIVFREPVGTATASQLIRVLAMVNGYFE